MCVLFHNRAFSRSRPTPSISRRHTSDCECVRNMQSEREWYEGEGERPTNEIAARSPALTHATDPQPTARRQRENTQTRSHLAPHTTGRLRTDGRPRRPSPPPAYSARVTERYAKQQQFTIYSQLSLSLPPSTRRNFLIILYQMLDRSSYRVLMRRKIDFPHTHYRFMNSIQTPPIPSLFHLESIFHQDQQLQPPPHLRQTAPQGSHSKDLFYTSICLSGDVSQVSLTSRSNFATRRVTFVKQKQLCATGRQ